MLLAFDLSAAVTLSDDEVVGGAERQAVPRQVVEHWPPVRWGEHGGVEVARVAVHQQANVLLQQEAAVGVLHEVPREGVHPLDDPLLRLVRCLLESLFEREVTSDQSREQHGNNNPRRLGYNARPVHVTLS